MLKISNSIKKVPVVKELITVVRLVWQQKQSCGGLGQL